MSLSFNCITEIIWGAFTAQPHPQNASLICVWCSLPWSPVKPPPDCSNTQPMLKTSAFPRVFKALVHCYRWFSEPLQAGKVSLPQFPRQAFYSHYFRNHKSHSAPGVFLIFFYFMKLDIDMPSSSKILQLSECTLDALESLVYSRNVPSTGNILVSNFCYLKTLRNLSTFFPTTTIQPS